MHTQTRTLDLTPSEVALIGHVRGWCHDSRDCAMCDAEYRAYWFERQLDSIIEGI